MYVKNRLRFTVSRKLYTPLFTFCIQLETVFDLPSNTIDKAWMSILEIIYQVQWSPPSLALKMATCRLHTYSYEVYFMNM